MDKKTFTPDNLIAGDFPIVTESVVVATGQTLKRGALLGRVTDGGKVVLSLAGAGDGSKDPVAILAEAVDTSKADVTATAYLSGEFAAGELTYGTGHTAASVKDALRTLGIFLKTTQS